VKGWPTMSAKSDEILSHLGCVEAERARRALEAGLADKVQAIKQYQQLRFSLTYEDLLATERYGPAARFFLEELYGPRDFTARDSQFARVVPTIARIFPQEIVSTVASLAELHALSETLDTRMGLHLDSQRVDAVAYCRAWQRCCIPAERDRQISLTVNLGWSLDRLTRKLIVRTSLRMMRPAAKAAGLEELQHLLESGFAAFAQMNGAQEFLAIVESRERALASRLFSFASNTPDTAALQGECLGLP